MLQELWREKMWACVHLEDPHYATCVLAAVHQQIMDHHGEKCGCFTKHCGGWCVSVGRRCFQRSGFDDAADRTQEDLDQVVALSMMDVKGMDEDTVTWMCAIEALPVVSLLSLLTRKSGFCVTLRCYKNC